MLDRYGVDPQEFVQLKSIEVSRTLGVRVLCGSQETTQRCRTSSVTVTGWHRVVQNVDVRCNELMVHGILKETVGLRRDGRGCRPILTCRPFWTVRMVRSLLLNGRNNIFIRLKERGSHSIETL